MFSPLLPLLALASAVSALDFTQWSAPGPNDVRSPCPALNSLANHGIINHSGKGITFDDLRNAMADAFNIGNDVRTVLALGALFAPGNPFVHVDLDKLDRHNYIEHDASLSRYDLSVNGDATHFSPEIFAMYMSHFKGMNVTTIEAAAKAKYDRVLQSEQTDKSLHYQAKQLLISYGESSIYLMALGNATTGNAPVNYINIFFEQERLPWNEGWRPSTQVIDFPAVGKIIPKLMNVSGEAIPEGLIVVGADGPIVAASNIAKAFLGINIFNSSIPSNIQNGLNAAGLGSIF